MMGALTPIFSMISPNFLDAGSTLSGVGELASGAKRLSGYRRQSIRCTLHFTTRFSFFSQNHASEETVGHKERTRRVTPPRIRALAKL